MDWTRRAVTGGLATTILPLHPACAATKPDREPLVLEAAQAKLRLLKPPASETAVWAYNGQVPGPLIRVKKGEDVRVKLVNKLAQPTSLCWHGVRIANAMDGVAGLTQAPVKPGDSFDYRFTPPDAGLYWYHPHVFPFSAEQIGRGLYGLLVVDEPNPPAVDHDLLLVLADWGLDPAGQPIGNFLDTGLASADGRIGALVTVNSQPVPAEPVVMRLGARVRIRILNACAARIAIVALTNMAPTVVAIDGQPSELFRPAGDSVPIGPGSRFELIADIPGGTSPTPALVLRGGATPDRPLLAFAAKGKPLEARSPVAKLAENSLLPTRIHLEKAARPSLVIGSTGGSKAAAKPAAGPKTAKAKSGAETTWLWTLDGSSSDGSSGKALFRVKRGSPVSLALVNKTSFPQQIHVHGHVFRILHDLDDGWDPYWRESILIGPGRTKHIAFVADNPGKWAVESLILDRQVTGLAGGFEVT